MGSAKPIFRVLLEETRCYSRLSQPTLKVTLQLPRLARVQHCPLLGRSECSSLCMSPRCPLSFKAKASTHSRIKAQFTTHFLTWSQSPAPQNLPQGTSKTQNMQNRLSFTPAIAAREATWPSVPGRILWSLLQTCSHPFSPALTCKQAAKSLHPHLPEGASRSQGLTKVKQSGCRLETGNPPIVFLPPHLPPETGLAASARNRKLKQAPGKTARLPTPERG